MEIIPFLVRPWKSKRGFFFTLLTIFLISAFLLSYQIISKETGEDSAIQRVATLDSFMHSVDSDLPRQLYISGFRSIFILEKKILENGAYIDNTHNRFQELFYNGTLYGQSESIMDGARFQDIENAIIQHGNKVNANVTLSSVQINFTQEDPWNVLVTFRVHLLVNDSRGLVSWDRVSDYSSKIPISSFADPLYVIHTNGLLLPKIIQTPSTQFVQGGDSSNLSGHLSEGYYINSGEAPSFLQRLEGSTQGNTYGVESIVNAQLLSAQGISVESKSMVDHVYFSSLNPASCIPVQPGLPSWFRVDAGHFGYYNVSC